jgi:hypothetical protein
MNKARRLLAAGIGVVTPAFMATDGLHARAVGPVGVESVESSAPAVGIDQEALKSELLRLSPADKLRVAGDRIRIARSPAKPQRGKQTHSIYQSGTQSGHYTNSGMLFAWK